MSVRDIFKVLLEKMLILVMVPFILVSMVSVYVYMVAVPRYTTSTSLYILYKQNDDQLVYSDLTASELIVNDCKQLVVSDRVMDAVGEKFGVTGEAVRKKCSVSITSTSKTRVIRISVTSKDPVLAANVANLIALEFSESIVDLMGASSVKVIDYAKLPSKPSSPQKAKLIVIAGIVGLAGAICFIVARELLNNSIRTSEDVEIDLGLPVLARIPLTEDNHNE